jgi:hypothetical protein
MTTAALPAVYPLQYSLGQSAFSGTGAFATTSAFGSGAAGAAGGASAGGASAATAGAAGATLATAGLALGVVGGVIALGATIYSIVSAVQAAEAAKTDAKRAADQARIDAFEEERVVVAEGAQIEGAVDTALGESGFTTTSPGAQRQFEDVRTRLARDVQAIRTTGERRASFLRARANQFDNARTQAIAGGALSSAGIIASTSGQVAQQWYLFGRRSGRA